MYNYPTDFPTFDLFVNAKVRRECAILLLLSFICAFLLPTNLELVAHISAMAKLLFAGTYLFSLWCYFENDLIVIVGHLIPAALIIALILV